MEAAVLIVANLVALSLLGYGLTRLLLPARLWSERFAVAPFVGVALVTISQDYLGFFFQASHSAWAVLALSAVLLPLGVLLRPAPERGWPSLWWALPFAALAIVALIPQLVSRAPGATLTNHDTFSYAVLYRQLSHHAYRELPLPAADVIDRYYLFLVGDFWRIGLTNLAITLDSVWDFSFLSGLGARLGMFAGLVPVSLHVALRTVRPDLSSRRAAAGAALVAFSTTPLFLASEGFYLQLVACSWYPVLLAMLYRALCDGDRRSLLLAGLLSAGGLTIYPEMLPLVVVPALVFIVTSALRQRQRAKELTGRAAVIGLLAAGLVPFSLGRLIAAFGRLRAIHTGQWPLRGPLRVLGITLGLDPDPGGPASHFSPTEQGLTVAAACAAGWLLWRAGKNCALDVRTLLASTLLGTAVALLVLTLGFPDNGYVPLKAALTAGVMVTMFIALGAALSLHARQRIHLLAALLWLAALSPSGVRMVERMLHPRVMVGPELIELGYRLSRLPAVSSLIIERADNQTTDVINRAILVDHYASLFFCSRPGRRAFPSPGTRSYLSHVYDGRLDGVDPDRPIFVLQPRDGITLSMGTLIWEGKTLRLLRASWPTGTFELRNFHAPELDTQLGHPVCWARRHPRLVVRTADARHCRKLRMRLRAAAERYPMSFDGDEIALHRTWKATQTTPLTPRQTREHTVKFVSSAPPVRLPGEKRALTFALTMPAVVIAGCAEARWATGWYPAESDTGGPFRWASKRASWKVHAASTQPCYELELEGAGPPGGPVRVRLHTEPGSWKAEVRLGPSFSSLDLPQISLPQRELELTVEREGEPARVAGDSRRLGMRFRRPELRPVSCKDSRAE